MKRDRNDGYYLERIIEHCQRIGNFTKRFQGSVEKLEKDYAYQQAVTLSLIQIGENVKHLSENLKREYSKIAWRNISDTRNFIVHDYDGLDCDIVWDVIVNDIPALKAYCIEIQNELEGKIKLF